MKYTEVTKSDHSEQTFWRNYDYLFKCFMCLLYIVIRLQIINETVCDGVIDSKY